MQLANDDLRKDIIEYLEKEFLGPPLSQDHSFKDNKDYKPFNHLIAGMIFPQEAERDEAASENESSLGDDIDPLNLSFSYLTSSAGISICVDLDEKSLLFDVNAGIYELDDTNPEEAIWKRRKLKSEPITISIEENSKNLILEDKATLDVRVFQKNNKKLITASIINNAKCKKNKNKNNKLTPDQKDILSRVSLSVRGTEHSIKPYPKVFRSTYDEEEAEQRILYRNENIFGIGHSCSVDWVSQDGFVAEEVNMNFLPKSITKGATSELDELKGLNALNLSFLANEDNQSLICTELKKFVDPYKDWVQDTIKELNKLKSNNDSSLDVGDSYSEDAVDNLINKLNECVRRLDIGVDLLTNNTKALKAFQFANLAMLMQMNHAKKYDEIVTISDIGNKFFEKDHNMVSEFNGLDYFSSKEFNWRPFQLAYFLICSDSVINPDSNEREVVDLIWFATGGGKTEAYLLVSAFLIFYKKIMDPDHNYPEIMMRYTLSLLTQDQFIRSTRFITACEKIRRENITMLGDHEINIGLWIGGDGVPNRIEGKHGAEAKLDDLRDDPEPEKKSNTFIINTCPWCGTNLVPQSKKDKKYYGFDCNRDKFNIFCPSSDCEFHSGLPVQVIDHELYKNPPTFLLGTIDKFAQLAYFPQAGRLICDDEYCINLIIQDELHLISGPLGTVTGVFEAAFDTLMSHSNHKPKYLAATATIRGAKNQIKQLFARNIFTFPPSGIDHKDRFFSREDKDDVGRLYFGIMSQGHTAVTTTVRIAAAALQSTHEIQSTQDMDGYKTLVIYHNAKKEKSKTLILAGDDIPKRIEVIASNNPRPINNIDELSADISRMHAFDVKNRMEYNHLDSRSLDIVSVTSMLSVGVDIQRLGLMQVTGQPRQTSEFIQATSRVGRSKEYPGLVLVNYIASNPRDRSHYEQFFAYINSINRYVEPTSVTTGAEPALRRVLPTCLMILGRNLLGLSKKDQAQLFDIDANLTKSITSLFKKRLTQADPQEKNLINEIVDDHLNEWDQYIKDAPSTVHWHPKGGQLGSNTQFLTKDFGDYKHTALWDVMQSMRHVDSEIQIRVDNGN